MLFSSPLLKLIARIALAVVAVVLAILSFLQFLGAAAFYSAWYGRPGLAVELARASRRGNFFFLLSLVLEFAAASAIAPLIGISVLGSARFKVVARFLVALFLSLLATGVVISLLAIFRVV
jgi:hypothetical protein